MFSTIARFELRYQLRNPVFWVATIGFFMLAFASMTMEAAQIAGGGNVHLNSPVAVAQIQLTMSIFFMFVTTAFVGNVVVRDDESGFGGIIRSTKVDKLAYMFGRFSGAFLGAAIAFLAVPLAIWIGSLMPWLDAGTLGPNRIQDYLIAYAVLALPNIFITSAIFFAVACWTRSMTYSYLAVILFMTVYLALIMMVRNWPDFTQAAYIDPFASQALGLVTRYLTPAQANSQGWPIEGALLANRLTWVLIGAGIVVASVWRFRFAERGASNLDQKRQQVAARRLAAVDPIIVSRLPATDPGRAAWQQLRTRTLFEMKMVFRSPSFWVLAVAGGFNLFFTLILAWRTYDVPIWPRTFAIIDTVQGASTLLALLMAVYYSGEVVWRERERRINEIVDATPLPNWVSFLSKLFGVTGVLLMLGVALTMAEGILYQLFNGLTDIAPDQWLGWFAVPNAIYLVLLAILSIVVQALSPNKFVGWGILVLYLISTLVFPKIGLDHPLLNYAAVPQPLSELNGTDYGGTVAWWLRLYWCAFAVVLVVAGHLMWRRGTAVTLKGQWRTLPSRLRGTPRVVLAGALAVTIASGGFLYYNMNVLNAYQNDRGRADFMAAYEKKYGRYVHMLQPSITDVKLDVRLFPSRPSMEVDGSYAYVNATDKPLTEMHVRMFPGMPSRLAALSVSGAKMVSDDPGAQYWIYRFDRPLQPGEGGTIAFRNVIARHGLKAVPASSDLKELDSRVVKNGTFIANYYFAPMIGMGRYGFLKGKTERRKHGLAEELPPFALDNEKARGFSYVGIAMDRVRSDITVATDADQTPVAPGVRVSDRTANGRRTVRFVSRDPILNFFSILSARYVMDTADAKGVALEVYHDRRHDKNVKRMLGIMSDSLDYFRANFGPYQNPYARVVEVQDYFAAAQAFPGTIPYNENAGFIMDLRDPKRIDFISYVTAHELGHQYWFHQIMPADMEGSTILVESLAQYSALMVMKHRYGEEQIRRFLKYEMDKYLQGRRRETAEERPLARVNDQGYIHYNKASVVMYLLHDRLGEDRVNAMLRGLLAKYRFKPAPYARSLDLVQGFLSLARNAAERELVLDQLERITLYDLKAKQATVRRLADGRFETTITVDAGKAYSDGKGEEHAARFAEQVDIGVFAARPGEARFGRADVLSMQRLPVRSGEQVVRIVTRRKPGFAGVDPYISFIDRNANDNIVAVMDGVG
jgi:hypothetical protein